MAPSIELSVSSGSLSMTAGSSRSSLSRPAKTSAHDDVVSGSTGSPQPSP